MPIGLPGVLPAFAVEQVSIAIAATRLRATTTHHVPSPSLMMLWRRCHGQLRNLEIATSESDSAGSRSSSSTGIGFERMTIMAAVGIERFRSVVGHTHIGIAEATTDASTARISESCDPTQL